MRKLGVIQVLFMKVAKCPTLPFCASRQGALSRDLLKENTSSANCLLGLVR